MNTITPLPVTLSRGLAEQLAETFVAKSEEIARYRCLANISPLPMFIRTIEGACLFVNQAYLRMLEANLEQVTGFGWHNFLTQETRDGSILEWIASASKRADFIFYNNYTTSSGNTFRSLVRATLVPGDLYAGFCMPDDQAITHRVTRCEDGACILRKFFKKEVLGLDKGSDLPQKGGPNPIKHDSTRLDSFSIEFPCTH